MSLHIQEIKPTDTNKNKIWKIRNNNLEGRKYIKTNILSTLEMTDCKSYSTRYNEQT